MANVAIIVGPEFEDSEFRVPYDRLTQAQQTMTSWASVRKDLENAGAKWVDKEVVRDGIFITSRKPDDLDAFSNALLSALAESRPKQ